MQVLSRQCRVFSALIYEQWIFADILGGSGNTVKALRFPAVQIIADHVFVWLMDETDLDLLWTPERAGTPYTLRPSVVDPGRPSNTDTAAALYLDGLHQGRTDAKDTTNEA